MELSTRQPLRIGRGMVIAFLLLGVVGVVVSPHPTRGHVSQLGVEMKEMFATMAAHVATAQHSLLAWLTTPHAEEADQDKTQGAAQTHSFIDPEQRSSTHTRTDQPEQQVPLSERAQLLSSQESPTEALAFVHQKPLLQEATPHEPVTLLSREHQRGTQIEQPRQQEKELLKTTKKSSVVVTALPPEQSTLQAGKKTEATDTDKERPGSGKSLAKPEDTLKKQEEARALLEQMGYATNGTALLESAENGNTTLVNLLLTAGLSPDQTDTKDWTPLMYAAWNGHITTVSELLARGATVNAKNRGGGTALMVAAMNGHTATVQALQENGELKSIPRTKKAGPH